MLKKLNVLIVDSHPLIIECHKKALRQIENNNTELNFKIRTAHDCDSADLELKNAVNSIPFDLAILDINLPPSKCGRISSGEDLAIKIKTLFSQVKIIVFTSYNDNFRISNILQNINPEGFLLKNDAFYADLTDCINTVLYDPPYYCKVIIKLFKRQIDNDFILDKIDRQLLYHISIGSKTKDLPKIIPLSLGGIERRKRKLKDLFNVNAKEDKKLVKKAQEMGFI